MTSESKGHFVECSFSRFRTIQTFIKSSQACIIFILLKPAIQYSYSVLKASLWWGQKINTNDENVLLKFKLVFFKLAFPIAEWWLLLLFCLSIERRMLIFISQWQEKVYKTSANLCFLHSMTDVLCSSCSWLFVCFSLCQNPDVRPSRYLSNRSAQSHETKNTMRKPESTTLTWETEGHHDWLRPL